MDVDVTGEILSEEFLEILKAQILAGSFETSCGISLAFWAVAIYNYVYGYYHDFSEKEFTLTM